MLYKFFVLWVLLAIMITLAGMLGNLGYNAGYGVALLVSGGLAAVVTTIDSSDRKE